MPLLYDIPLNIVNRVSSGEAELVGAVIKEVASGRILAHVQPTQGFYQAVAQARGALAQSGFSPLGVIGAVQNEQIKTSLEKLGQGLGLLQDLQIANIALTGIGIGVSVAGFAIINMRLNAIEKHLGNLREEVSEIGRMFQEAELRRLFSEIRAALKDLDSVATRTDYLALSSSLQRQFSSHLSTLSDLLVEAMTPGRATTLPVERLDLIWTLSSAKWLCEEAELQALFVSEDLDHVGDFAGRYINDNLRCLDQLNPDALARLVAATEGDLIASVSKRRQAAQHLGLVADGFAGAIDSLSQQQSLSLALLGAGIGGREYIEATSKETKKHFLIVMPVG
ncbi:hypothetical protein [Pseudosulfitobacter sp. SM2401]|uniref:hypothetical protein n=1 Tax=Pseudosulfitobacter sp. SM2401 TaxID=3350098 RepID=UPI0036F2BF4F